VLKIEIRDAEEAEFPTPRMKKPIRLPSVAGAGYAVFDIETTGLALHPDSIVEIAVVHVDAHGEITGTWDTLLKPDGSVGPTSIHGITQDMVQGAPSFGDIAEHLYGLFADRVAVAHNLPSFDGRFVGSHFTWAGIEVPELKQGICTYKYARRHLAAPRHTLGHCCDHLGIQLIDAHQALTDTVATAKVLRHFIDSGIRLEGAVVPTRPGISVQRIPIEQMFLPRAAVLQRGR
jgi:DNA polymerase III subunit epsilon